MLEKIKTVVRDLYAREPARVNGAIVAFIGPAVIAAAALVGVTVAAPAVLAFVVVFAPLLVAELTRPKVVPEAKAQATANAAFRAGLSSEQPVDVPE